MPAHRKISLAQIIELLVYLEKHRDIRLGTVAPKGNSNLENEHWKKIAKILNNCPGDSKDATKWKSYWNELKWRCRKKLAKGCRLLPHERRVLALVGGVKRFTECVMQADKLKLEKDSGFKKEHDDDSNDVDAVDNSRLSGDLDQTSSPEPMPIVDVNMESFLYPEAEEVKESRENVPDWLQQVEQSRLGLEERTTRALEQMSAGISAMATAMSSIAGSLQAIEASVRSLNNKNET